MYLFETPLQRTRLDALCSFSHLAQLRVGILSLFDSIDTYDETETILLAQGMSLFADSDALFLNASLSPSQEAISGLIELVTSNATGSVWQDGELIAYQGAFEGVYEYDAFVQYVQDIDEERVEWDGELLKYPWDFVKQLPNLLPQHIDMLIEHGDYESFAENVWVASETTIHPTVIFDASQGNIVIDQGVSIGAYSVLQGPLWIGANSVIQPHSFLRMNTSIGKVCKVGGEIEGSLIYDFSNKQHHGFLGHSVIGSWVNIGAGTSNSDLKNTYGQIRVDFEAERFDTGMQFFGCVIGDLAKVAINTSIYTGKIIGVGAQIFGDVLENIAPFTLAMKGIGRENGTVTLASILETTERMFERRDQNFHGMREKIEKRYAREQ